MMPTSAAVTDAVALAELGQAEADQAVSVRGVDDHMHVVRAAGQLPSATHLIDRGDQWCRMVGERGVPDDDECLDVARTRSSRPIRPSGQAGAATTRSAGSSRSHSVECGAKPFLRRKA